MTVELRARPTTYNGIEMRSRLEARVASWLDSLDFSWQYEPRAFASAGKQYLPDLRADVDVPFSGKRPLYVEIKPTPADMDFDRMKPIYASEPDAVLAYFVTDWLETIGCVVYEYDNGAHGGLAALVSCPICSWVNFGWVLGVDQHFNHGLPVTTYSYCPLCDKWRLGGETDIRLMPEWNAA